MPVLRIFIALMVVGVLGPLLFVYNDNNSAFLIVSLGLRNQVIPALVLLAAASLAFCAGCGLQRLSPTRVATTGVEMSFTFGFVVWLFTMFCNFVLIGGFSGNVAHTLALLLSKVRGATPGQTLLWCFVTISVLQAGFLALSSIDRPSQGRTTVAAVVVIATSALSFAVGNRLESVLVLLIPALALGARGRLRLAVIGPPVVIGLAIIYVGELVRAAAQGADLRQGAGVIGTFLASFSQIDPMAVAVQLSERIPTTVLDSLKALVLWPVPHNLIPHKALVATVVARYLYFSDTSGGITLGMFGEYYYYFGLIGMLLTACASGWVASFLGRWSIGGGAIVHHAAFLFVTVMMFSSLRDGVFNDIMAYGFLAGLVALHWSVVMLTQMAATRRLALE